MRVIFTKNSTLGSNLIRWGLKEPVSHIAFVFDEKLVIHSSLNGVELQWFNTFKKKNVIVHDIQYALSLDLEEQIYQSILDAYDDAGYDYGAYFYFSYRVLLNKITGESLPDKNKWGSESKFLCTELADTLPNWLTGLPKQDHGIISPYQLYLKMSEHYRSSACYVGSNSHVT